MSTASSPVTELKNIARLRDGYVTINDILTEFETKVHQMEPDGPGVEDALEMIDSSREFLIQKMASLHKQEVATHDRLMVSLRKRG